MKKIMFFLIATVTFSCFVSNPQAYQSVNKIDDTYKKSHSIDDCEQPIGFSRNTENKSWAYPGQDWKFAKINIKNFDEVNDSILLAADFNAMFNEKDLSGRPLTALNIEKGEFVIAKNQTRVNNFYVFKLVDQIDEKVKIDYRKFKIRSSSFYKLKDFEKLRFCILNRDTATLGDLIRQDKVDVDLCTEFENTKTTPLILSIEKGYQVVFDKLIELNANIDETCRGNRTALMAASRQKNSYYFSRLVELGADPNIKDERGKTVHEYLKHYGNFELLELLEK